MVLAQLVDDLAERLQAGDPIDLDTLTREHPDHADAIRRLLPAIEVVASLSCAASHTSVHLAGPAGIPAPGLLGDFRLIREVGRGGMGVVYEAEQISLGRRVALKVLPFAAAMDNQQLARFKTEAQAAACLHHTNIVPVHAVGCERGVHYYAMQFIDGRTLADTIRELRRLEGHKDAKPRDHATFGLASGLASGRFVPPPTQTAATRAVSEGLPPSAERPASSGAPSTGTRAFFRSAAQLGIQAAEALDFAHRHGILHRDIKPANLLIDAEGRLWVTDFGLARVQADSGMTITGDLLGTLRYMSPEQALAKRVIVDQRTDIYSLGATLYELFTLWPAVEGKDRQEVLRQIAFEEPKPLRRLNPSIPRELETIVAKAMRKDPQARYATAQELADDLRRYLEDKPIRARRPGLIERAAKWSRRHTAAVAGVVAVLMVAVVALAVSNVLIRREQRRTDANLQLARHAIEEYLTKVSESRLLNEPGLQPLRKELLESALKYYQALLAGRVGDDRLTQDLGQAYLNVANIKRLLGEHSDAVNAGQSALRIFKSLAAIAPPDRGLLEALTDANDLLGSLAFSRSDAATARRHFEDAILAKEEMVKHEPSNRRLRRNLVELYGSLGVAQALAGDLTAAEQAYRRSAAIADQLVASHPDDAALRAFLATSRLYLAQLLNKTGRLAESRAIIDEILASSEAASGTLRGSLEYRYRIAHCLVEVGGMQRDAGDFLGGRRSLKRGIEMAEALVDDSPQVVLYQRLLARALTQLTVVSRESPPNRMELEEAIRAGRRAIEILLPLITTDPPELQDRLVLHDSYSNLAHLSWGDDDPEAYFAYERKAIESVEPFVESREGLHRVGFALAQSYQNMAERRLAQGEKALARQFYERSVGLLRRLIAEFPNESSNRDRLRISLFRLSVLDLESGQLEQAERRSREVLSLGEDFDRRFPDLALLPPHMTALARFGSEHRDLARILEEQGRFQEAVDLYDKAIVILEDATRRQPRDRFAPRWLAEARRSRDAAIAKQRESAVARDSTATLSESRSLDDVMPNGKEAFRKE